MSEKLIDFELQKLVEEKYLEYAMATITSRSLPDVRDGLKPVHRRLLYAMWELNLDPKAAYKKCARIIGDVIGKFHPHGEMSVYDALVRMAQSFSQRYMLIEGQGNFGSVDGDSQAAMRYTEAKLSKYALFLLSEIGYNTVEFRSNYDFSDKEPMVLPALVPNLLANGSEGIAVGMATQIPPHNLIELLNAATLMIQTKDISDAELMSIVQCPDFPTAGEILIGEDARRQIFETGKGAMRLRARYTTEDMKHGKYRIVITDIPYQVNKKRIIEQLAELYQNKQIPFIENFQDASDEAIRVYIYPKRSELTVKQVMDTLYKLCDLEIKFNCNFNALSPEGRPEVMGVRKILTYYIEHLKSITLRRFEYRLNQIASRLDILGALMIVYLNLDEVIRIIREEDDPKLKLMERFELTDHQAESILNTRLRALKKLEEIELKKEKGELEKEQQSIEAIKATESSLSKHLVKIIKGILKSIEADPSYNRRTQVTITESEVYEKIEIQKVAEPITVVISKEGWIKGHKSTNLDTFKFRSGDELRKYFSITTNDKLLFATTSGKVYTLNAEKVLSKGDGSHISSFFEIDLDDEVSDIFAHKDDKKFFFIASSGRGMFVASQDLISHTKAGKGIISLEPSERAIILEYSGEEYLLTFVDNRRMLAIKSNDIPMLKRGKGVMIHKVKTSKLTHAKFIANYADLSAALKKQSSKPEIWMNKRGVVGRLVLGKTIFD